MFGSRIPSGFGFSVDRGRVARVARDFSNIRVDFY
jgi:hypothetical protein